MKFSYVGLKLEPQVGNLGDSQAKSLVDLRNEFVASVGVCVKGIKSERWLAALRTLESDPLFADAEITSLVSDTAVEAAGATFDKLSAGHRIVLLTITKLVELVEERTLVLMDEPEGHLHPPLLSAFVRALSDLLIGRNGVAVIATHSPVVLQEVPSKCVWLLQRTGRSATAYRPSLETFGENVGLLTREVFGLEVSQAGFHSLLERAVKEVGGDYSAVLSYFDGQLGAEARAIARVLTASTSKSSEK
jgi:predicted ATPase